MKVLNAEPFGYNKEAVKIWVENKIEYLESSWAEIDNTNVFPEIKILIVRLARKIGIKTLNKFPKLKYLVTATTGHDHLEINELTKRNITLITLQGEDVFLKKIPSTAEHTWALMMSLIRNIPFANSDVAHGYWRRDLFRGNQLQGKILGIIGMGRTGSMMAKYASAFEMQVIYYDSKVYSSKWAKKINNIEKLVRESDIVSIHVHLNSETENLLNEDLIKLLKRDAIVINTSRGKLWDEQTLADALERKKLKGVAADVLFDEHGKIKKSPLWQAQSRGANVILTPHIGGATWEAMWKCEEFITQKAISNILIHNKVAD